MKRGQVTTFIIVGIIVLIAVVMTIYVNREYVKDIFEQTQSKLTQAPQEIQPINNEFKSCLTDLTNNIIGFALLQGGYIEPEHYVYLEGLNVAYWYDKGDISPDYSTISKEISKGLEFSAKNCVDNIGMESDYNIYQKTNPKVNVKINNKNLIVQIEYPIVVEIKNISYNLNNFNFEIENEFDDLILDAQKIIKSEKENPNNIDITLLQSLNSKLDIITITEKISIYSLTNDNYILNFANKF